MTEPDTVSVRERLRTVLPRVRRWIVDGACVVAAADLTVYAFAGPCGPKPDVFDFMYLAAVVVLLVLQVMIIALATSRRASSIAAGIKFRAELWCGLFTFAVFCLQLAMVRFPFVHPSCS